VSTGTTPPLQPRSRPVVAEGGCCSRAGAHAVTGLLLGALATAVSLALGLPLLRGEPGPGLGSEEVVAVAVGSVVGAGLCGIMGVAAGALVRNQVVGVVGGLLLMFIAMPLLNAVDETAAALSPFGAAVILAGDPAAGHKLSWAEGGLVLAAWTLPLLIAAIMVERRRDLA
jgi:hypothetical protein